MKVKVVHQGEVLWISAPLGKKYFEKVYFGGVIVAEGRYHVWVYRRNTFPIHSGCEVPKTDGKIKIRSFDIQDQTLLVEVNE